MVEQKFEIITYLEECLRKHSDTHDVVPQWASPRGNEGDLMVEARGRVIRIQFNDIGSTEGWPRMANGSLLHGEGSMD